MLAIDPRWVLAAALLSLRLSAVWALTPLMTLFKGPLLFRTMFTAALAGTLAAGLPQNALPVMDSPAQLALSAVSELLLGAVLALGLHAAFGALHFAGRLMDLQIGFGAGGIFDPSMRTQSSALSMALQWVGVITFFALEGHHGLLRGVAYSIERVPLGTPFTAYVIPEVVAAFGSIFTLALMVCAPVLAALLVLEVGLAVVSKALPQMNVFFVSVPLKIFVGLAMLTLTSRQLSPVLARGYVAVFEYWQKVLG